MKFKKFLAIVCLLFAVCVGFYGCGEVFKTGPNANDAVIGNGGLAVMKGEYIYFVNGYKSASENYQKNKGDKIYYSAIYRVKAKDSYFNVVVDEDTGESRLEFVEGSIPECDENGNLPGAERLVSKVAGFENTKLYIIDNTLYFTTHSNSVSVASGEWNTTGVDVYRVDLNGKNFKKVYSVGEFAENGEINFYKNGGNVYGIFFNGTSRLAIYKNNKEFVELSGVTDVAMPYFNTYSKDIDTSAEQTIFYLQDGKLKSLAVGSKNASEIECDENAVPSSLIGVKNKKLFYVNKSHVKYVDFGFTSFENESKLVSYLTFSECLVMDTERVQIVAKTSDGDIEIYKYTKEGVTPEIVRLSSKARTEAKLIGVNGENVFYYTAEDGIFMANEHMGEVNIMNGKKGVFNGNSVASVTDKYVYFFTEFDGTGDVKTNPYLTRIDISNPASDGAFKSEDLSVRLREDYKLEEKETEEETETAE